MVRALVLLLSLPLAAQTAWDKVTWMRVSDRYSLDPVCPNHLVGFRVAHSL